MKDRWRRILFYWITWVLGMAMGTFVAVGSDVSTRLSLLTIGLILGFGWAALMSGGREE